MNEALQRISNRQENRLEGLDAKTDWSFDWKKNDKERWMLEWTFVDHSAALEYCVITRCGVFLNDHLRPLFW